MASGSLPSTATPGIPEAAARLARSVEFCGLPILAPPPTRCSRQYEMIGSPFTAGEVQPLVVAPWFIAPSPIETMHTLADPASFAARATPVAIGTPAPTMVFSPMKPYLRCSQVRAPARCFASICRPRWHLLGHQIDQGCPSPLPSRCRGRLRQLCRRSPAPPAPDLIVLLAAVRWIDPADLARRPVGGNRTSKYLTVNIRRESESARFKCSSQA